MAEQISEPTLLFKRCPLIKFLFEEVSEHNQEIPQPHTAAKSRALWGTTKTINRPYVDFLAQIKKSMKRRLMCVCVCVGGGNIWFEIRVLIAHKLKSAYMTTGWERKVHVTHSVDLYSGQILV